MHEQRYLVSFHIIERINKQNLVTWSYPSLSEEVRIHIVEKCYSKGFIEDGLFFFLRKNNLWVYVKQFSDVSQAVVIITRDFAPNTYKILSDILIGKFMKTRNPVDLVKIYLELYTTGITEFQKNGTDIQLNLKNCQIGGTKVKELIELFKLQIILIYNAILLKKRILVYHPNTNEIQEAVLAMTRLVLVRNPNQYVIPFIQLEDNIKDFSFYLAGTLDAHLKNNKTTYDLFVNLATCEIVTNSKGLLDMTKFHKEIAHFLVQATESGVSEVRIIEDLRKKTEELLNLLKSFEGDRITVDDIKRKNFSGHMENFMINLASSENMLI